MKSVREFKEGTLVALLRGVRNSLSKLFDRNSTKAKAA